jgi:hypothetical protein
MSNPPLTGVSDTKPAFNLEIDCIPVRAIFFLKDQLFQLNKFKTDWVSTLASVRETLTITIS